MVEETSEKQIEPEVKETPIIEEITDSTEEQVQKLEFKGKNFTGCSTEDKNGYLFILI